MTPPAIKSAIRTLGWTQRELARRTQRNERTVRRWLAGDYAIPADIGNWLDSLAARVSQFGYHPRITQSKQPEGK